MADHYEMSEKATMAIVIACKDCGKSIFLTINNDHLKDQIGEIASLVRQGHKLSEMDVEEARKLSFCECEFEDD